MQRSARRSQRSHVMRERWLRRRSAFLPRILSSRTSRSHVESSDRHTPFLSAAAAIEAPLAFSGRLRRVEVTIDVDQRFDGDGIGSAITARE